MPDPPDSKVGFRASVSSSCVREREEDVSSSGEDVARFVTIYSESDTRKVEAWDQNLPSAVRLSENCDLSDVSRFYKEHSSRNKSPIMILLCRKIEFRIWKGAFSQVVFSQRILFVRCSACFQSQNVKHVRSTHITNELLDYMHVSREGECLHSVKLHISWKVLFSSRESFDRQWINLINFFAVCSSLRWKTLGENWMCWPCLAYTLGRRLEVCVPMHATTITSLGSSSTQRLREVVPGKP